MAAIRQHPSALQYASKEMRNDKEVREMVLEHASEEMRDDKQVREVVRR